MTFESARGRELTQAVADHVLRDGDTDEILAIVNKEDVPHKVGRDHGAAGPCLDRLFHAGVHLVNLPEKLLVDERSFFE